LKLGERAEAANDAANIAAAIIANPTFEKALRDVY
jgi:hypothetical protein